MIVHLVDGTYELFRHFYGLRRFNKGKDKPLGAVVGQLNSLLEMIEKGATHLGVATDHVIESFRNDLWPGYKTGAGIERALRAQFTPLEDALALMGVAVWPMVELEADDALAAAARISEADERVEQVCIWANDKDLAQCVRDDRVVQVDRRNKEIRDAAGVRKKFGVEPALIPDLLALVGDAQDGYPGIAGIGKVGAARLLNQYGPIESFPDTVLGKDRERALLFKDLATLRTDAPLFRNVDELEWRGPSPGFAAWAEAAGDPRLLERCLTAWAAAGGEAPPSRRARSSSPARVSSSRRLMCRSWMPCIAATGLSSAFSTLSPAFVIRTVTKRRLSLRRSRSTSSPSSIRTSRRVTSGSRLATIRLPTSPVGRPAGPAPRRMRSTLYWGWVRP